MGALLERITREAGAAQEALPRAGAPRRARALAALGHAGLPGARDENWRYANLRSLERQSFAPAPPATPGVLTLPTPVPAFARYVFIDGRFAPERSASPTGGFAPAALAEPLPVGQDERFALLNAALAGDGARLTATATQAVERIELLWVACAPAASGASYPRLEIELACGAHLELIERHLSAQEAGSFVNGAASVHLAHGARLTHIRLQELSAGSVCLDTLSARLEAGAHYRLHSIQSGAQAARTTLAVTLAGEAAAIEFNAAALGERTQVQDCYARIEHAARGTRTRELFRGIAAGRARVAFNGKVVVAAGATGADSQQSLRGLLAGPQAEIDVRPQLEIYTDEVRCSHGATAGKLDEQMLFYLLSRGLARATALRLLKWAFLEDALRGIEVPELRRQIEARLARLLPDAAPEELP